MELIIPDLLSILSENPFHNIFKLPSWLTYLVEQNHMTANPDKTADPQFCISLGDTVIEPSDTVDLLGIVISDKLTFHQHVKTMTSNAALKLNALQRQSKWLDPEVRLDYGRTFVLSSFQYCPLVWYVSCWTDMLAVEHIQKHMLRIVYEDYDSPYEDLLAKCHMSTNESQRSRTLAIEVYKAVNGMTPNYIQELVEVKEIPYNLRDPTRTIILKSNSTTDGLKSLKHEGNKIWNGLLVDIKTSESLAIFKIKINKWRPRF